MQTAVKAMVLDRLLADYGPETRAARRQLHEALQYAIDLIDNAGGAAAVARNSTGLPHGIDSIQASLRGLTPQNDDQRWWQAHALTVSSDMADDGWLIIEESESGSFRCHSSSRSCCGSPPSSQASACSHRATLRS